MFMCAAAVIAEITSVNEVPAIAGEDTLAIFISGDGGWRKIDQDISTTLASQGIYVIGVNSMKYFWKKKTPEQSAEDISVLINSYIYKTKCKRVILIGYSFGADVIPFIINRLPEKTRLYLAGAVLLGISTDSTFEVSAGEWLGRTRGKYITLPEVLKISSLPLLFVEGKSDDHAVVHNLDKKKYDIVFLEGGHHFDGDYNKLAWVIINWNNKIRKNK